MWTPSDERVASSAMANYLAWLASAGGLAFPSYEEAWRWSVADLDAFWASIWDYFEVFAHRPYERVLGSSSMPGAAWFPGATLNYAEHALARRGGAPAVVAASEAGTLATLSRDELAAQVAAAAGALRSLGVGRGDRVAAYLPNITEAVVAFLATASLGAVWSACAPEFGTRSVVDRFRQIEPTILVACDGYRYGGRDHDRRAEVAEIRRQLPSLQAVVGVPVLGSWSAGDAVVDWGSLPGSARGGEPAFEPVAFDHPLWILYSSGTTGAPKAIVQGHGGILLEHLKALALHMDLGEGDRFFWFTTTGWMMWNLLVGGLLVGSTVVLYDGSPAYPDLGALWRLSEATGITYFGASAPYLTACLKAGLRPGTTFDLSAVRSLGSTGAPLPAEGFRWVYEAVHPDLALGSVSGGTDVCTAFVGSCPLLPVHAGEIQCRMLGAAVEAFDPGGHPLVGSVGELVVTEPMPSMPTGFWNDPGQHRYRESYFETYPGVWRHGDWITITERGSCIISGRSDATLNRGGVRMGTAEFYAVVEDLAEVADSLVVDTGGLDQAGELLLFVVPARGVVADADLCARIRDRLRIQLSPRHVPDRILAVAAIPRTLNGKKVEVPVRRILMGMAPPSVFSADALANPEALTSLIEAALR
ncbi:MAG TPA: acetoacetate--CoA ligase [Actinomycetota bacterium]|nr:acetoacetate--CoA ligase [Actinomycetota bacterium]